MIQVVLHVTVQVAESLAGFLPYFSSFASTAQMRMLCVIFSVRFLLTKPVCTLSCPPFLGRTAVQGFQEDYPSVDPFSKGKTSLFRISVPEVTKGHSEGGKALSLSCSASSVCRLGILLLLRFPNANLTRCDTHASLL